MARGSSGKSDSGNNRIRFIMLEADLNDGNLQQITQAISNALKPPVSPVPPRMLVSAAAQARDAVGDNADEALVDVDADDESDDGMGAAPATIRPRRQRTLKTPDFLDIDLTSGDVPWVEYAKQKSPKKDTKRYLTVARWFKEHRGKDAIGVNEVYTCYRTATWPYDIKDFDAVFRALKKGQFVKRIAPGQYAINQLGESAVDKLDAD